MEPLEKLVALATTGAFHRYRVDVDALKAGMHRHLRRQPLHGHVQSSLTGHALTSKSVFKT